MPQNVRSYIARFDSELTSEELNSESVAFRMLFVPKLVGKPGKADEIIEFLKPDSEVTRSINRDYVAFKEVERPKYLPGEIVKMMQDRGYPRFCMHWHTELWRANDARNPGRGLGIQIAHAWYWYDKWIDIVEEHCKQHAVDYQ